MVMDETHVSYLRAATPKDLYRVSLESARAKEKEIFIFELESLSDLFDEKLAEDLRKEFLKNNIKIKQITNIPALPKFTENNEFVNELMTFRYVPKDIFSIDKEIVIFDDTVAIYTPKELLVIKDKVFANNQKQLFMSIWDQGYSPHLNFDYKPNHSFYKDLNFFVDDLQIIVWPDADAKIAYKGMTEKELEEYVLSIIKPDPYYNDSSYIIMFIWSLEGDRMIDVWKFKENYVDTRSGPLGDVRVYREGKICKDLELASGNTLLVLGYEEKLRRQSKDLKSYLDGPVPILPLEIANGRNFFAEE